MPFCRSHCFGQKLIRSPLIMGMSVLDNQPSSQNFLNPANHRLVIKRLPNIIFHTQKVTMPDIACAPVNVGTPFSTVYHSGDRIDFAPLVFEFAVHEDLGDYLEIFRWIEALGFPEDHKQYRDLKRAEQVTPMDTTGLQDRDLGVPDGQQPPTDHGVCVPSRLPDQPLGVSFGHDEPQRGICVGYGAIPIHALYDQACRPSQLQRRIKGGRGVGV